jgi:hypothetical protein
MQKCLISMLMVLMLMAAHAVAIERRAINDIDVDHITRDTQVVFAEAGEAHVALAWWVPNEFWQSILENDPTLGEENRKSMLDTMAGISLLAIVQADISQVGAFNFYTKEEIKNDMVVSFTDKGNKKQKLQPLESFSPDLGVVLGIFKPILSAAMGNMGKNFHFYVLADKNQKNQRLLDPYQKGVISIQLAKRNKETMNARIEMPLNSLFVPRICPNGKEAHITWNYCPWSGVKLKK